MLVPAPALPTAPTDAASQRAAAGGRRLRRAAPQPRSWLAKNGLIQFQSTVCPPPRRGCLNPRRRPLPGIPRRSRSWAPAAGGAAALPSPRRSSASQRWDRPAQHPGLGGWSGGDGKNKKAWFSGLCSLSALRAVWFLQWQVNSLSRPAPPASPFVWVVSRCFPASRPLSNAQMLDLGGSWACFTEGRMMSTAQRQTSATT